MRQAKALLRSLPEGSVVLGGDFNTWALWPFERTIPWIRREYRQPEKLDEKGTVAVPVLPDRRVDYLLFKLPDGWAAHYRRLDVRYGSDHYPLLGRVER